MRRRILRVRAAVALGALLFIPVVEAADQKIVSFIDAKGQTIGTAMITKFGEGIRVTLDVRGLTPGLHAIHFHEHAVCKPPDFSSAGGHYNPDNKGHGILNENGPHAGDLYNFRVEDDGTSKAAIVSAKVSLDDDPSIFGRDGTALIIHEKADDLKSDPDGGAGKRIACALVTR